MRLENNLFLAIFLGFLVSWVPRIAPFIFVRYKALPKLLLAFLRYLPISILSALTLSSLVSEKTGFLATFDTWILLASLPTFYIAYKSKNLLYAVLTGIITMALIRFFVS